MSGGDKTIAVNRKARFRYHLLDRYEAGIALVGSEVKSLRAGRVNLTDAYAAVQGGEVWLHGLHISPFDKASRFNHDPTRPRKLLLHRHQIRRLTGETRERGFTLVPVRLYFRNRRVKVELAVARGKKLYDKREAIARREARREAERALKERVPGRH